jgi:hypothetical protein
MPRRRLLPLHRAIEARTARVHDREHCPDWIQLTRHMRISASVRRIACGCLLVGICAFGAAILAQQKSPGSHAPAGASHAPASESQPAPIESRLPASVQFYFHWRGTKSLDAVQGKNGLLRLWSDPDFAPIRRTIISRAFGNSWFHSKNNRLTSDQLAALKPLFENEALMGRMARSGGKPPDAAGSDDFLIYDGTGKAELIEQAEALLRKSAVRAPKLGSYTLGDAKIESAETPDGTNYSARVGNYYLRALRKEVIEELVTRFDAKPPHDASLVEDADWKRARQNFTEGDVAEAFVRIGDSSLALAPKIKDMNVGAFARAVHLERVRAWTASLNFAVDATRLRFALLGDTSAGSIFDIAGTSVAGFETQPLARDGSSYSVSKLNLPAIYQIFHGAFLDSLPQQQAGNLKGFDMLGSALLGMPVPDVLALLGGEMATVSSAPGDTTYTDLFAISIRKPEEVLRVLRKALGPMIRDESPGRDATVLELGTNTIDPRTKAQRLQLSYVAVTPQLLIYSQRKAMVLDAVTRMNGSRVSKAESLSGNPDFQRIRAKLPNSLSGFSYTQMSKQTWEREFSVMLGSLAQASASKDSAGGDGATAAAPDWLQGVNLAVFPRYLHSYASGWWKTTDGVYFDSYLQ